MSRQINEVGELLSRHLHAVNAHLLETPPRTLLHHDFDADNLFFTEDGNRPRLFAIDWQLTTGGHAPVDVAWLIAGQCEPGVRRDNEKALLRIYHSLLLQNGVAEYTFDQCWDDYRMAMLLPAARIAVAVGMNPDPPDGHTGFWNVVFPRYCQAIQDLRLRELLSGEWQHDQ
jgi:aminoglycoside/choline kinase family phosphotransferase